jgi:hypothetical protein
MPFLRLMPGSSSARNPSGFFSWRSLPPEMVSHSSYRVFHPVKWTLTIRLSPFPSVASTLALRQT